MRNCNVGIGSIRDRLAKLKGTDVTLRVHNGRNRYSSIRCKIEDVYPAVFTARREDTLDLVTYAYSAVVCGDVSFAG